MADYPEQRSASQTTKMHVQPDVDDSEHHWVRETIGLISDNLSQVEYQYQLLEDRICCVLGAELPTAAPTPGLEPADPLEMMSDLRSLAARCEALTEKLASARRRCVL